MKGFHSFGSTVEIAEVGVAVAGVVVSDVPLVRFGNNQLVAYSWLILMVRVTVKRHNSVIKWDNFIFFESKISFARK